MMSSEEKEQIKSEIKKQIAVAEQTIASLQEQTKPVAPDNAIGRITRMEAIQQKSVSEANLRKAEEALMKLKEALKKVDEAGFGICAKCGNRIPLGRILIVPETRHCVNCVGK